MIDGHDIYCTRCNARRRKENDEKRSVCSDGSFKMGKNSTDKYEQFKQDVSNRLSTRWRYRILQDFRGLITASGKDDLTAETLFARIFALEKCYCNYTGEEYNFDCYLDKSHKHTITIDPMNSRIVVIDNTHQ